jgi:hypothetical protein
MRALSASELLAVWEQGLTQSPAQRALTLLAAACPETSPQALGELSIGQRDARLLTLRQWTFGPQLVSVATCAECGARLELNFDVDEIRAGSEEEPAETLSSSVAEYTVRFRLPNSRDMASITDAEGVADARHRLLDRCILSVHQDGEQQSFDQLPATVIDAVVAQMAQTDPQADVRLALTCPECDHEWQEAFDIVSFFWHEIGAWAYRVLRQVHTLASNYGWREDDIFEMSPLRRQIYLDMVNG